MPTNRQGRDDGEVESKYQFPLPTDVLVHKGDQPAAAPTSQFVNPLLTDMYQISMSYAYFNNNQHEYPVVFDLFFRENPFQGEFTIFAGLEEVIRHVSNFKFTDEDIAYLKSVMPNLTNKAYFDWLRRVDCSQIKLYAIPEGTMVFPRIPLITIEGPLAVVQLLETTLLTLVNYPSLLVTNAARHVLAAGPNKRLIEFGLRRAQGVDGGVTASKFAYMGGFHGTSNVLAAKLFGIPCMGTHAHSFVSSFTTEEDLKTRELTSADGKTVDFFALVLRKKEELGFRSTNYSELISFTSYAIAFPRGFLALVDTYDTINSGVKNFLVVAAALDELGYRALGIRLDSGDLAYLSKETRKLFIKVGEKLNKDYFGKFTITASNDINESTLLSLKEQGHEIDTFGVGTNLVTCQAQPALGCVYKLVSVKGIPKIKVSQSVSKVTLPGRKYPHRLWGAAPYPIIDLMIDEDEEAPKAGQRMLCLHPFDAQKRAYVTPTKVVPLHKLFWDCGKITEDLPSLTTKRNLVLDQLKTMREDHMRLLNPTPYKVSVSQNLYRKLHSLWLQEVPIQDLDA